MFYSIVPCKSLFLSKIIEFAKDMYVGRAVLTLNPKLLVYFV